MIVIKMAKKVNNHIPQLVNTDKSKTLSVHTVFLIIGPWRKLFKADEIRIIIAEALNYCVCFEKMNIAGYLVTDRRVCLVLEIDKTEPDYVLHLFYEKVKKEIKHRLEKKKYFEHYTDKTEEAEYLKFLFTRYKPGDDFLVRLITGRKVELPYYNAHLERLKEKIHDYDFCSVIDYSGGVGPVMVKLIKDEGRFLLGEE